MEYYAAVIKTEAESLIKLFICECTDTVLASRDMRVNKIILMSF